MDIWLDINIHQTSFGNPTYILRKTAEQNLFQHKGRSCSRPRQPGQRAVCMSEKFTAVDMSKPVTLNTLMISGYMSIASCSVKLLSSCDSIIAPFCGFTKRSGFVSSCWRRKTCVTYRVKQAIPAVVQHLLVIGINLFLCNTVAAKLPIVRIVFPKDVL